MKQILCVMVLTLGGCTAGDISTVRSLTVDDLGRAVRVNHDARHEARTDHYSGLANARRTCQLQALKLESDGKFEEAEKKHADCAKKAAETMPSLLTLELVREGKDEFNDLRSE